MSYFEFPHTRSYDGDLGYIIKRLDELTAKYGEFMEYNAMKFADPITWDINTVYPAWNIVFFVDGYYIAVKPVPAGINITNTDYWELITPFHVDMQLNEDSINPIANQPVTRKFNSVQTSISNVSTMLQNEGIARENADNALDLRLTAAEEDIDHLNGALSHEQTERETADTALSRDIETANARIDNIASAITPGTTSADAELIDIRTGYNGIVYPTAGDAVRDQIKDLNNILDSFEQLDNYDIYYPDAAGHQYTPNKRMFWGETIPAGSILEYISIPTGMIGANPSLVVEVWELNDVTLNKVFTKTITPTANNVEYKIPVNTYSNKVRYVSYIQTNVQTFYKSGETGYSWQYSNDIDPTTTSMLLSTLNTFNNMKLIGGYYARVKAQIAVDFFSGWQSGNIIVFGDSTIDGSSTTDHTANVIGTDRTASEEPYVLTSIMENMLNTFTGGTTRVYNAGFGGKTLNYIADNYAGIMAAFSDVKSALLVIDVNSANGTRAEYETNVRKGLTRMIELLRADNIAVAIASPQPMFFYPTEGALPAINSAGEFALAVNIGKDIAAKYELPFINLGELTNKIMTSPYLKSDYFFGDRIHFGDGGHKVEAYELFGELIHPIAYFDGNKKYISLASNMGELSSNSGISSAFINGWQSIVLQSTHTRTDVLHRVYVLSPEPFKISGINIDGWASYYDVFVDGVLYTTDTTDAGASINAGPHEITIKPTGIEHIVRYSGIVLEKV